MPNQPCSRIFRTKFCSCWSRRSGSASRAVNMNYRVVTSERWVELVAGRTHHVMIHRKMVGYASLTRDGILSAIFGRDRSRGMMRARTMFAIAAAIVNLVEAQAIDALAQQARSDLVDPIHRGYYKRSG